MNSQKISRFTQSSIFVLCLGVFLNSCYQYGPTHAPYTQKSITPPPPVKKLVGAPYTQSEYMNKTYHEIVNAIPDANVTLLNDSIKVLFPNNIMYPKNSINPSKDFFQPLTKFALILKRYLKTSVLITGHTDNEGSEKDNVKISELRAEIIKSILISKQVASSRLYSWGLGSKANITNNKTESNRAKNRRVEFVILYDTN